MQKYNKYWNLNDNGIVLKNVSHVRFYTAYEWISEHLPDELPKVTFLLREPDPNNSRADRYSLASKVTRQLVFPDSTVEKLCIKLRKWIAPLDLYGRKGVETLYWFLLTVEREANRGHIHIGEYVDKVTSEARRGYLPYQVEDTKTWTTT